MLRLGRNSVRHIFFNPYSRWVFGYTTSSQTLNFTVDYLVNSVGLSKQEAIVASSKVSPFKSPVKPDSVVDFLKTTGFNHTQIKKIIFTVPRILSCDVDKTLKPKLEAFKDFGLCGSDLADVVSAHPHIFLRAVNGHILPSLETLKLVWDDKLSLLEALKKPSWMLGPSVSKTLPANIALLKSYGLSMDQIKLLFVGKQRYFMLDPKWLHAILIRIEEILGIPRNSAMFIHGVFTIGGMSEECLESKFNVFRSFGWSESDILTLARHNPRTLSLSESKLRKGLNFYMKDIGYQPADIASSTYLLTVSLERRVIPRIAVLKVLKEKRLVRHNFKLQSCVVLTEERFLNKFVLPFKNEVLDLYNDYMRKAGSASKDVVLNSLST